MSLETIRAVLAALPAPGFCPLCGAALNAENRSDEHIFPSWLQKRFDLGNLKLNIPNYLGKRYKSVQIDICKRCNNEIFSGIERTVRDALVNSATRDEFLKKASDITVVRWLCKILLLNAVKSNWNADYREQMAGRVAPILADTTIQGLSSVRLFLLALIENKHFQCMFPVTGTPYLANFAFASTYYLEIDERDNDRIGAFDFLDFPVVPTAYIRMGPVAVIMVLDGGLHNKYRSGLIFPFYAHKLHPMQALELFGRVIYDTTLLVKEYGPVDYFYDDPSEIYSMKFAVPFGEFPYRLEDYDEEVLTDIVARLTMENPDQVFDPVTREMRTKLFGPDGKIWTYPVTDAELAAAARQGAYTHNDVGLKWRTRE